ncbi:MAG: ATP-dependent helicase, partial [Actinomycetales bacterium]
MTRPADPSADWERGVVDGRRWTLQAAPIRSGAAPVLDAQQQAVVDHRSGPLAVLAGPGTGKTTTIVAAIAARIQHDGVDPRSILALTFGRRAAADLRDRLVARLGGGRLPTVATFHSYAYGLLQQTASPEEYLDPPRLLSGAEEDVRIRELLAGAIADGSIAWPDDLQGAVGTLGLANEIRAVLARAKDLGLDPATLSRIGSRSDRPAWVALGELARQEAAVALLQNVYDYGELMHRAVVRARSPEVAPSLARAYRAVYVDEYQDTDRLQVALLASLVGPQTALVVVGDPDQAIYGFRGADVTGMGRFPTQFPTADSQPAPVVVLGTTRRFGSAIRDAATELMKGQPLLGMDPALALAHREPTCTSPDPGSIQVQLFDGESARSAQVAQQLRQAHLYRGLAWSQMAILVRGHAQIPAVQRALMQQGVPVAVAAD